MTADLVLRLRNLVSLNEVEHGGPYRGTAATVCVEAMNEAANEIERLREEAAQAGADLRLIASDIRWQGDVAFMMLDKDGVAAVVGLVDQLELIATTLAGVVLDLSTDSS